MTKPYTRCLLHSRLLDALEDVMGTGDILLHHTKGASIYDVLRGGREVEIVKKYQKFAVE